MFFFLLRCDFLPEEVYTMAKQKWQINSQATVYLVLGGVQMMTYDIRIDAAGEYPSQSKFSTCYRICKEKPR